MFNVNKILSAEELHYLLFLLGAFFRQEMTKEVEHVEGSKNYGTPKA